VGQERHGTLPAPAGKALVDAKRDYEELVRAGLMPGDDKTSKQ